MSDRVGRRWGVIGSVALFSATALLAGLATSIEMLAACRFVDGLGIGAAVPNCAALLSETGPRSRRPLIIGLSMAFMPVGAMTSALVGTVLMEPLGWRTLFYICGSICAAVTLLLVLLLPESPNFLVHRAGRHGELVALISRLTGPVEAGTRFTEPAPSPEDRRLGAVLAPGVRRISLGLWIGYFGCLLASFQIFSWLPTLLHGRGFGLAQSSAALVAVNAGSIAGGFLAGFLNQRFGVRRATLGVTAGAALTAAGLAFARLDLGAELELGAAFAGFGLFLACMHSGFYTIAAIAYPPDLRAFGIGATAAFGRLGAITSSFTGAIAITAISDGTYFFLVIAGVLMMSFIAVFAGWPKVPARL